MRTNLDVDAVWEQRGNAEKVETGAVLGKLHGVLGLCCYMVPHSLLFEAQVHTPCELLLYLEYIVVS